MGYIQKQPKKSSAVIRGLHITQELRSVITSAGAELNNGAAFSRSAAERMIQVCGAFDLVFAGFKLRLEEFNRSLDR